MWKGVVSLIAVVKNMIFCIYDTAQYMYNIGPNGSNLFKYFMSTYSKEWACRPLGKSQMFHITLIEGAGRRGRRRDEVPSNSYKANVEGEANRCC